MPLVKSITTGCLVQTLEFAYPTEAFQVIQEHMERIIDISSSLEQGFGVFAGFDILPENTACREQDLDFFTGTTDGDHSIDIR